MSMKKKKKKKNNNVYAPNGIRRIILVLAVRNGCITRKMNLLASNWVI